MGIRAICTRCNTILNVSEADDAMVTSGKGGKFEDEVWQANFICKCGNRIMITEIWNKEAK